jgi:ribosomal protein S17E
MAKEKSEYSDMFTGQFEDGKQSFLDILEDVDKSKEIISQLKGQIQVLTSENQNNNARVDQSTAYLQKRLTDKDLEVKQLIELNQKKDK